MALQGGRDILAFCVGTGLVLPHYPRESVGAGIDIPIRCWAKAKSKMSRGDLSYFRELR